MGQLIITTNGKEIQDEIMPSSFYISKDIGNRSSILSFDFINYDSNIGNDVVLNNDITVTYNGEIIFGGTITNITARSDSDGRYKSYAVQCNDYSHKLSSILINTRFAGTPLSEIVNEVLVQATGTEYTLRPISSPPIVSVVTFPRIPITDALDRATELVGYTWYVNSVKQVIVVRRGTSVSNYSITPTSQNYITDSFQIKDDLTQIRNNVVIRGGASRIDPIRTTTPEGVVEIQPNEYITTSDGTRDSFLPPVTRRDIATNRIREVVDSGFVFARRPEVYKYTPAAQAAARAAGVLNNDVIGLTGAPTGSPVYRVNAATNTSVELENYTGTVKRVSQDVIDFYVEVDGGRMGIDGVSNDADYEVLWNSAGNHHFVRFTSGNIPARAEIVRVRFTPEIPVIASFRDEQSIMRYGQRDYFDKDITLTSAQDAQDRAEQEVRTYKDPIKIIAFNTYNTDIFAGETIPINVPRFDIDDNFLVQNVSIQYQSGSNNDNDVLLVASIKGSSIKNVFLNDLFIRLLTKRDDQDDEDLQDIDNILNIRNLGSDNIELTDTDISVITRRINQTNRYVWSTPANTPTLPLVRGLYSRSTYNTDQARTAFSSFTGTPYYTPTITSGALSSVQVNWNTITGANAYLLRYSSSGTDGLRTLYRQVGGNSTSATLTSTNLDDTDFFANLLNGRSNMFLWATNWTGALTLPVRVIPNYVVAPRDFAGVLSGTNSIQFSWTPTTSMFPVSYTIDRFNTGTTTDATTGAWTNVYNGAQIGTTITGAPTDQTYTYRLRATITTTNASITNKNSDYVLANV